MNLLPTPRRLVSALNCSKRKTRVVEVNDDEESVIFEKVLKLADDCSSEAVLETDEVIFEKLEKIQMTDVANDLVDEPSQSEVEIEVSNGQHDKKQIVNVAANPLYKASKAAVAVEVEFEHSKQISCPTDDMKPIPYSKRISKQFHCTTKDTRLIPSAKDTELIPSLSEEPTPRLTMDVKPVVNLALGRKPIQSLALDTKAAITKERNTDDDTLRIFTPQMLLHRSFNRRMKEVTEETKASGSIPELVRFMSHVEGREKGFEITLDDFKSFICCSSDPQSNQRATTIEHSDDASENNDNEYADHHESGSEEKLQETSSEPEQSSFQTSSRDEVQKMERSISRFSWKNPQVAKEKTSPTHHSSSRLSHDISRTSTRENEKKEEAAPAQRYSSCFSGKCSPINTRENGEKEAVPVQHSGSRLSHRRSHINILNKGKAGKAVSLKRFRSPFSRKGSCTSICDSEEKEKAVSTQHPISRFSRKASTRNTEMVEADPVKRSGSLFSRKSSRINTQENEETKEALPVVKLSGSRFPRKGSRINAREKEMVEVVPDKRSSSDLSRNASRISSGDIEEKQKAAPLRSCSSHFSRKGSSVSGRGAEMVEVVPGRRSSSHLSFRTSRVRSRDNEEDPVVSNFVMSKAGLPPLGITSSNISSVISSEIASE